MSFSVCEAVTFLIISRLVWFCQMRGGRCARNVGFVRAERGVLWSGQRASWFLDDLSACMLLLFDFCSPIGAESLNQKQEFNGFDAKSDIVPFQHLLRSLSCCCCSGSKLQWIHLSSFEGV